MDMDVSEWDFRTLSSASSSLKFVCAILCFYSVFFSDRLYLFWPFFPPNCSTWVIGSVISDLNSGITFTFTFSHLADAFIQSDLQLGNT